jgi:hypothetical protein
MKLRLFRSNLQMLSMLSSFAWSSKISRHEIWYPFWVAEAEFRKFSRESGHSRYQWCAHYMTVFGFPQSYFCDNRRSQQLSKMICLGEIFLFEK